MSGARSNHVLRNAWALPSSPPPPSFPPALAAAAPLPSPAALLMLRARMRHKLRAARMVLRRRQCHTHAPNPTTSSCTLPLPPLPPSTTHSASAPRGVHLPQGVLLPPSLSISLPLCQSPSIDPFLTIAHPVGPLGTPTACGLRILGQAVAAICEEREQRPFNREVGTIPIVCSRERWIRSNPTSRESVQGHPSLR